MSQSLRADKTRADSNVVKPIRIEGFGEQT